MQEFEKGGAQGGGKGAHARNDIVMICEMRLAVAASVDPLSIQIDVVCETH
jgi:hypothetical protein